mgnify:CR=1 FL=1
MGRRRSLHDSVVATLVLLCAEAALAQPPQPTERVTFAEAIQRAIERNPSSAIAAAGILRADALLAEVRSGSRLQINGNVTTTTLNTGVEFEGTTVTPRNSLTAALDVRMPVYVPAQWALRVQAADQRAIAESIELLLFMSVAIAWRTGTFTAPMSSAWTSAPRSTRSCAAAAPMPDAAPVITTCLPA